MGFRILRKPPSHNMGPGRRARAVSSPKTEEFLSRPTGKISIQNRVLGTSPRFNLWRKTIPVLCNLRSTRGGQARALPKVEKFWTLSGKPPSAGAGKLEIDCTRRVHFHCQSPLLGSTILWEKVQNFSILGKGPPRAIYG